VPRHWIKVATHDTVTYTTNSTHSLILDKLKRILLCLKYMNEYYNACFQDLPTSKQFSRLMSPEI